MAVIADYTGLTSTVASYLARADLTTFIPNFVEAAERLIYPRLVNRGVEIEFTATTSSGVVALSGLTNYLSMKWLRDSASGGTFLKPLTAEQLYETYPDRSVAETHPRYYARDGANIVFGPAAADGVALDGVYYAKLAKLTSANTTNWVISNYPELLLYGALMQAQPFIAGDERIPIWGNLLKEQWAAVREEERRERKTGSSRAVKVI